MASPSQSSAAANDLKVFLIGAIGGLLLLMALVTWATNAQKQPPPPAQASEAQRAQIEYIQHPEEASARVDEMAKQTGGDFSRLTPEDQQWLDGMTAGHGAQMLYARAQAQKRKVAAKTHRANTSRAKIY